MLDLVGRRGTSPLSFLVRYDAPWQAHFVGDAAVCYLEAPKAAVAWSDPLCDEAGLPEVIASFDAAMREEGRGTCLVAVTEATARVAMGVGFSALKVGEEPWFDLAAWRPARGDRGKKLRWLRNHARRAGVEVAEYGPEPARSGGCGGGELGRRAVAQRPRPAGVEHLRADGASAVAFALAPMRGMRRQLDPRARWLG